MSGRPPKRHSVTQPLDKPYRLIPLTQGQNAIVDEDIFEFLCRWNWYALWSPTGKTFYAVRMENRSLIRMHWLVLPREDSKEVDHIDGNGLNNRKNNLRQCTRSENSMNHRRHKDGFKGVSWNSRRKLWESCIWKDKKQALGFFSSPVEAAHAYDIAARKLFGTFAKTNF